MKIKIGGYELTIRRATPAPPAPRAETPAPRPTSGAPLGAVVPQPSPGSPFPFGVRDPLS